jgi:alcohol dehydrogenase (cytochrome c)
MFRIAVGVAVGGGRLSTGVNRPSYRGTHSGLRYSVLDQINASNVQLAPAWVFQTGDKENGLQATPIVIDGVMYLSSASTWVFALDGDTGRLKMLPGV